MKTLEELAGVVAVFTLVSVPALNVVWFLIHPFVAVWRRLGPRATYAVAGAVMAATVAVVLLVREPLLRIRFGVSPPLVGLAVVFLAIGLYIGRQRGRALDMATLVGLPEISAGRSGGLVTGGIYARIRNPRYVEGWFVLAAGALLCNYLAVWVLLVIYPALIWANVLLEERELRARFGEAYDAYCRRVPRFIPRGHRHGVARVW